LRNTLGGGNRLGFEESEERGSQIPRTRRVSVEEAQITLGEPSHNTHTSLDGKRRVGFQGVWGPLYIDVKPKTRTCLGQELDMSG
jgi:hypothetical protein